MAERVEVYRGIAIDRARIEPTAGAPTGYEAVVLDWRLVSATLQGLRAKIDEHLDRNGPGSGIFRREQIQP